jgi:acetyl-CoA carboxylase biotin carboxylase subunit
LFKRALIANRGEVAARIVRACRALGIESVAAYSTADRQSPHLSQADARICIGPGPSGQSYLNRNAVLQAALTTECQALHPGFGFLAEDALFAAMCEQDKVTFIGPTSRSIRLMGDKSLAKQTFGKAGLETIPGSDGNVGALDEALHVAREVGFPVLLKASAGGGGKGIRVCRDAAELTALYAQAKAEAEKAFGNPAIYVEKMIPRGRHIEFQVLADAYGSAVHLGERECSIQRKNQKLLEEAPSPVIDSATRRRVGERVAAAVRAIGYRSAGTVEFLRDAAGQLFFMEMNTRLQVEHPVTEMITGLDIVAEQFRIAAGHPLSVAQDDVVLTGHAVECRINAEDPSRDFAPSPGTITAFRVPSAAGTRSLRLETHVREGYDIPPFYDSMICKIIARGSDRPAALRTMEAALKEFEIGGIKTTIPLHLRILRSDEFTRGQYDTGTLARIIGG